MRVCVGGECVEEGEGGGGGWGRVCGGECGRECVEAECVGEGGCVWGKCVYV